MLFTTTASKVGTLGGLVSFVITVICVIAYFTSSDASRSAAWLFGVLFGISTVVFALIAYFGPGLEDEAIEDRKLVDKYAAKLKAKRELLSDEESNKLDRKIEESHERAEKARIKAIADDDMQSTRAIIQAFDKNIGDLGRRNAPWRRR